MLDVMFNLDSEWPVWMDFRALYSACLELANYLGMTISIIVITSSSSILLDYFLRAWKILKKMSGSNSGMRMAKIYWLIWRKIICFGSSGLPQFFWTEEEGILNLVEMLAHYSFFPNHTNPFYFMFLPRQSERWKVWSLWAGQILLPPPPPATKQNKTSYLEI